MELRKQLNEWMRLRVIWIQQEHLAQYRFARAVWGELTPEQQQKLISGEWKSFAKQDTGHNPRRCHREDRHPSPRHLLKGHGVIREEQQNSLELKLTKISRSLGKLGRTKLQLPEPVVDCVRLLMEKINQPLLQTA